MRHLHYDNVNQTPTSFQISALLGHNPGSFPPFLWKQIGKVKIQYHAAKQKERIFLP